jgi:hypothetical protein
MSRRRGKGPNSETGTVNFGGWGGLAGAHNRIGAEKKNPVVGHVRRVSDLGALANLSRSGALINPGVVGLLWFMLWGLFKSRRMLK